MIKRTLTYLLLLVILAGCQPAPAIPSPTGRAWAYAHLRALGKADGPTPSQDLIAEYIRRTGPDWQIRLDLLDMDADIDYDLHLALDLQSGGSRQGLAGAETGLEWDIWIRIPAAGQIEARKPQGEWVSNLQLRVQRNPSLDTVVLSLNRHSLPSGQNALRLEVFLTPAGSEIVADSLPPVSSSGPPPPALNVLLAFWDTYPAYSPAQALRRWNGAHSGPASERHGLGGLLAAVQETQVPVFLLDLKTPASISALDYSGGLAQVRTLARRGLVYLPDALPSSLSLGAAASTPADWVVERLAGDSRQAGLNDGLAASPAVYAPALGGARLPYPLRIAHQLAGESQAAPDIHLHVQDQAGQRQVTLPPVPNKPLTNSEQQATPSGPSLALKRLLANAAAEGSSDGGMPVVWLGGSLPQTNWGSPAAANRTLAYIAAHPWLHPLHLSGLLSMPRQTARQGSLPASSAPAAIREILSDPNQAMIEASLLSQINNASPGPLLDLAWQNYRSLLDPAFPNTANLPALKGAYLGQIGFILAAARWAEGDMPASCSDQTAEACTYAADLDWDGMPEYVLQNQQLWAVFEAEGGYMPYAFLRTGEHLHQIVGPSSQFQVGLSDPSMWKPELGQAGDPSQLRGAFSDILPGRSAPHWDRMSVNLGPGTLTFSSEDGHIQKVIYMEGLTIEAQYQSMEELRVQVPLVLNPWMRFEKGWGDLYSGTPDASGWAVSGGPMVRIQTGAALTGRTFIESRLEMQLPEDPDYEYPPGHFLPFPLALAEIQGTEAFTIRLLITP